MSQRDEPGDGIGRGAGLGALYRTYAAWLRRRLGRRFGKDAAEDLTQETYLRLAKASPGAEPPIHPKAYLMRVATHLAQDQAIYEHRHVRGAALAQQTLAHVAPVEVDFQLESLALKQIILGMPKIYRDVFLLSRMEGWTYEEIAQRLGLSEKTVEWRMSRALNHCASQLGRER